MSSHHMFIKVRNLLNMSKRQFLQEWKNVFRSDEDGSPLTYEQVIDELLSELAKGHEYIPLGKCDNFDYVNGGCKGHPDTEQVNS